MGAVERVVGPIDWNAEEQLAQLARAGGPLRRAIAALAGRMVARRGWERLGFARAGDYARERLGMSARSLQELARVDGALAGLPHLEATLATGQLPWSKVRMLARFVTLEDEASWIAHARGVSVRTLEHHVRSVDRGGLEGVAPHSDDADSDGDPVASVRIRGPAAVCFKWHRAREAASRAAGEPVGAGGLLEWVTAEALSALPGPLASGEEDEEWGGEREVRSDDDVSEPSPPGGWLSATPLVPEVPPSSALSWELPPFLRPLLDGLEHADDFELDARLRRAVRLEQRRDAEIAPLLCHVTAPEHPWRDRYQSLATLAREQLGMSPRKARALMRLERVGALCPELRAAHRDGRLSWVQAQSLARVLCAGAEGEWRGVWVAFAERVSVRRLQAAVDQMLLWHQTDLDAWNRALADPEHTLASEPEPGSGEERQTCARARDWEAGWSIRVVAPADVVQLFRAVACELRRSQERETGRLPDEWEVLEEMLDHALRTWGLDGSWLRRRVRTHDRVFARDGWRCTVPGCSSRRNLQAHHVVFRSAGGGNELANQTTLCAFHHLRGVHGGLVRVEGCAPDALRFELGLRSGRPPLQRFRSGDRVA